MITCWSVKGGSGTSVVAALLALACGQRGPTLLLDGDGDQPAIFGVESGPTGFRDWWRASDEISEEALLRLGIDIGPELTLVPAGSMGSAGWNESADERRVRPPDLMSSSTVIVDAGTVRSSKGIGAELVAASSKSLLVVRPCYLAAQRIAASVLHIDGLIVVEESGRALRADDVADVAGAPVVAVVPWDSSIARVIDAGRLSRRVPKHAKALMALADDLLPRGGRRGR